MHNLDAIFTKFLNICKQATSNLIYKSENDTSYLEVHYYVCNHIIIINEGVKA